MVDGLLSPHWPLRDRAHLNSPRSARGFSEGLSRGSENVYLLLILERTGERMPVFRKIRGGEWGEEIAGIVIDKQNQTECGYMNAMYGKYNIYNVS